MDAPDRLAALLSAQIADDGNGGTQSNASQKIAASRLAEILPKALAAFEIADIAFVWLTSPNAALGGSVPLHLILRSDLDAIKVRRILAKIAG